MCCNSTVEWTRYHSIPIAVAVELCRYWLLRYLLWYSSTLHVLDKELFLSMHSLDVCWPKKTVKSLHCSHACVCSGGNRCVGFVSHDLCAHLCLFLCVFCPPPPSPRARITLPPAPCKTFWSRSLCWWNVNLTRILPSLTGGVLSEYRQSTRWPQAIAGLGVSFYARRARCSVSSLSSAGHVIWVSFICIE